MDEYAEYLYKRRPRYRDIDPGDLTAQRAVRERLNCKPFKWFMENIAFDLPKKYPPVEPPDFANGEIRSQAEPHLCIDTEFKKSDQRFGVRPCTKDIRSAKGEQNFQLTWHKDVRPKGRNVCWDVSSIDNYAPVNLFNCHGMQGNQLWKYNVETKQLVHGGNPRCLLLDDQQLYVTACDADNVHQKWQIEHVDSRAMARWDNPMVY